MAWGGGAEGWLAWLGVGLACMAWGGGAEGWLAWLGVGELRVGFRAWRIMLIFLILCYASNAHLLNIYASRIYYYAQYYAHSGS